MITLPRTTLTKSQVLEEYGLSCESDMSLVDEEDLVVLETCLRGLP
jgi:hypothetical protein